MRCERVDDLVRAYVERVHVCVDFEFRVFGCFVGCADFGEVGDLVGPGVLVEVFGVVVFVDFERCRDLDFYEVFFVEVFVYVGVVGVIGVDECVQDEYVGVDYEVCDFVHLVHVLLVCFGVEVEVCVEFVVEVVVVEYVCCDVVFDEVFLDVVCEGVFV